MRAECKQIAVPRNKGTHRSDDRDGKDLIVIGIPAHAWNLNRVTTSAIASSSARTAAARSLVQPQVSTSTASSSPRIAGQTISV
jgi:hypothetical protein